MASNASKVKSLFKGLCGAMKRMSNPSDPLLFAMALRWMARVYLPYIPLTDGGQARGRLVGLLAQYNVKLPESQIHNKIHAGGGVFDAKMFTEGVREGRAISPNGARVSIQLLFNENKKALKLKDLKDKTELVKDLNKLIVKLVERGGS